MNSSKFCPTFIQPISAFLVAFQSPLVAIVTSQIYPHFTHVLPNPFFYFSASLLALFKLYINYYFLLDLSY